MWTRLGFLVPESLAVDVSGMCRSKGLALFTMNRFFLSCTKEKDPKSWKVGSLLRKHILGFQCSYWKDLAIKMWWCKMPVSLQLRRKGFLYSTLIRRCVTQYCLLSLLVLRLPNYQFLCFILKIILVQKEGRMWKILIAISISWYLLLL